MKDYMTKDSAYKYNKVIEAFLFKYFGSKKISITAFKV